MVDKSWGKRMLSEVPTLLEKGNAPALVRIRERVGEAFRSAGPAVLQ